MRNGFRQTMAWLHTWSGLLVGWVLFFIFLTGTTGYFDVEIDRWMQPERPLARPAPVVAEAVAVGMSFLERRAPAATQWTISPPGGRENPDLRVSWRDRPANPEGRGRLHSAILDPSTGEAVHWRATGGGRLLYRMHYRLHYLGETTAYWIVGVCSMAMLVSIITGVITHRRIFRDFFTFRPGVGRRSWLDGHNLLGTLALPFHLMITYTGLLFIAYLYMAPVIAATYGPGEAARQAFIDEMFGRGPEVRIAAARVPAPLTALEPLLAEAEISREQGTVRSIRILYPGDAHARIVIAVGAETPSRDYGVLVFDGASGALLDRERERSVPKAMIDALLALHEGLFAGPVLRWLYFLSGLLGTAMIGTGLVLWTVKRRERLARDGRPSTGLLAVEHVNVGVIVGLPVAIAAYFWANRLIPADLGDRAAWEAHAMFAVWAVALLHSMLRPVRRAWLEQVSVAAAAFALLPVLNAVTTDRHLGVTLFHGDWALAGFDLTVAACGVGLAAVAWMIGKRH